MCNKLVDASDTVVLQTYPMTSETLSETET